MTRRMKGLSHAEAEEIVTRLSEIFEIPRPVVYYAPDEEMRKLHYWAFYQPEENYIVFREHEIPVETATHELFHALYYFTTGDPGDYDRSEGIAQWAGSLWQINGPELMVWKCQVCNAQETRLRFDPANGELICANCGSAYEWVIG